MDYPITSLKIDRSFVSLLGTSDNKHKQIINAIIKLATTLNFTVIAEGVETNEQVEQLLDFDCNFRQGYFFSEALAADSRAAQVHKAAGRADLAGSCTLAAAFAHIIQAAELPADILAPAGHRRQAAADKGLDWADSFVHMLAAGQGFAAPHIGLAPLGVQVHRRAERCYSFR